MRTNAFTFKKTKRIKVVETFNGISVDLTVQEAVDLRDAMGAIAGRSPARTELFDKLYAELDRFLSAQTEPLPKPRQFVANSMWVAPPKA